MKACKDVCVRQSAGSCGRHFELFRSAFVRQTRDLVVNNDDMKKYASSKCESLKKPNTGAKYNFTLWIMGRIEMRISPSDWAPLRWGSASWPASFTSCSLSLTLNPNDTQRRTGAERSSNPERALTQVLATLLRPLWGGEAGFLLFQSFSLLLVDLSFRRFSACASSDISFDLQSASTAAAFNLQAMHMSQYVIYT